MIGVLIVTHRDLGEALIDSAEFITGQKSEAMEAVSIDINEKPEKLRQKIAAGIKSVDRRQGVLVQRFLPTNGRRDVRVLVLGEANAWAMQIEPAPGEFRANIHLGGTGKGLAADGKIFELAQQARKAIGLDIAGVDLMQDAEGAWWVGEVNFTPGFKGLEQATGADVAAHLLKFAAQS